jgi:pimeloyl-ACP methyl ester carboxylesterase
VLVGHSQGALDAVRLTQRGAFDVQGVVTLGGPTGQLVVPDDVPELSVEHDEDVVPALGGLAATGAGGLHRLVVRRSLYRGGPPPGPPLMPFAAGAKPHALTAYRETLALADASADPRIARFEREVRPFLTASDGRIVLVRADRPVRPPRDRRGAAAGDR